MPNQASGIVKGDSAQPVFLVNRHQTSAVAGTKSTLGDNTLLAAPGAGFRLVVWVIWIQNESSTAVTIQLVDNAVRFRQLLQSQGDKFLMASEEWARWDLAENAALKLNLNAAVQVGYSILYSIEPV